MLSFTITDIWDKKLSEPVKERAQEIEEVIEEQEETELVESKEG